MPYKKISIGVIVLALLVGALSLFEVKPKTGLPCQIVSIGETRVRAEVARTPESRTQGLSGRVTFPAGSGMLFMFEDPGFYSFWMKEMKFPIDIIWINKEKKVVGTIERALPESFPQTFMPQNAVLYVLEVPAGFVKNNKIIPETVVDFSDC